jgi:hypothetical protein
LALSTDALSVAFVEVEIQLNALEACRELAYMWLEGNI